MRKQSERFEAPAGALAFLDLGIGDEHIDIVLQRSLNRLT